MATDYEPVILGRGQVSYASSMADGALEDALPKFAGLDEKARRGAKMAELAVQEWLVGHGAVVLHGPLRAGIGRDPDDDFQVKMAGRRVRVNVAHSEREDVNPNPLMGVRCLDDLDDVLTVFTWRDAGAGKHYKTPEGSVVVWLLGWCQPERIRKFGHFVAEETRTFDTEHRLLSVEGQAFWQIETGYLREMSEMSKIIAAGRANRFEKAKEGKAAA